MTDTACCYFSYEKIICTGLFTLFRVRLILTLLLK
jgi:hypothetical protein